MKPLHAFLALVSIFTLALLGCERQLPSPEPAATDLQAQPADGPSFAPVEAHHPEPAAIPPLSGGARIEDERNTINVFQAAAPATVFVTQTQIIRHRYAARALEVPAGSGSGFIWDKDGHIVTNFHVIADGHAFTVTLFNQNSYPATFVGGEPRRDIAVLKIDAPAEELTPIRLPPEGASLDVGQKTIAIGNPFGLDHTLTTGVVSAMGREVRGFGGVTIRDMIQTDASINPGNSGGPLLDSAGQLIGMNTMIYSQSGASAGIGFAVPVHTIRRMVNQIIATGRVEQVGLGVSIVDDHVARRAGIKGVIVEGVAPDSPADKAGLRGLSMERGGVTLGDVIVGIEDKTVNNYDDLYNALEDRQAGQVVQVSVRRSDQVIKIPIELYALPE